MPEHQDNVYPPDIQGEAERSAWRVVGAQLTKLTSEDEIEAVDQALSDGDGSDTVSTHLKAALSLMSDRKALKKLEAEGILIHEAQRGAFDKLYGYTSDAGGIRHALLEDSSLDYEDAKFMLVACSAFVNLLRARSKG
jgi:hypothetical protein